jgi:hypothetical protein
MEDSGSCEVLGGGAWGWIYYSGHASAAFSFWVAATDQLLRSGFQEGI